MAAKPLEGTKVFAWRLHLLLNAGVEYPLAVKLAQCEYDTHEMLALLERGWSPEQVAAVAL